MQATVSTLEQKIVDHWKAIARKFLQFCIPALLNQILEPE